MLQAKISPYPSRVTSIDIARFFGIFLVFYGHLIEQVMYLGSESAATQYKWLYSFHMPLFFVLAGYVAKPTAHGDFTRFFQKIWSGRLVPYFFFSGLAFAFSFIIPGWFPTLDLSQTSGYIAGLIDTVMGFPAFNIPLWFLASLVGIEVLHRVLGQYWSGTKELIAGILVFYLVGYYLNDRIFFFGEGLNFWMVNLVPLGYAFYLLGVLLRRLKWMEMDASRPFLFGLCAACLAGVFLTYDLNQGPFRLLEASVFLAGAPGSVIWFPITALMGITLVLAFARLVPQTRLLQHMGKITLVIYGLHGLYYHFVNAPLAQWVADITLENHAVILILVFTLSALSVFSAGLMAVGLRKTVPFLVGGNNAPRPRSFAPITQGKSPAE